MNRAPSLAFRVAVAAIFLFFGTSRIRAQEPASAPTKQDAPKQETSKQEPAKPDAAEEDSNPFAPEPAPTLPPGMSGSDVNDPRAKLAPGLYDAGETSMGIKHLLLLKKPSAFQLGATDPDDPKVQKTILQLGIGNIAKLPKAVQLPIAQLAFANSDFAFQGNHLFLGNFYGVNIYDISNPANTTLLTSMVCPGGQGDVSVYKNLLFMSVEMPNGRLDCGTQGFPPEPPPPADEDKDKQKEKKRRIPAAQKDRFRGVRIFDISDIKNPKQVAAVQTCRGSHTHTLVLDPNDKENVYIYVSGTSFVRQTEELAGCSGEKPDKDPNTALFRIDVIKVPVAAPQDAKIVSTPRLFIDARTGALNGLTSGGSHGKNGKEEKPADTDQCHDITVYTAIGLAAGACSGNGILLDIKDPVHPKRLDAVNDPNYSYWHSASFSNDGTKVVFTDEWGGGLGARCRPNDPNKWGADAIFRLKDDKLTFANYYKLPAAQGDTENCVAHNGSLVPVPGRDIEVQAWYQGGISIMDFTDPAQPFEIAYFDRGPIDPKMLVLGGDWSAYWYNGNIYASEIARGLDVFELTPSKFLTQNEIDAAKTVHVPDLNVQNQQKIEWSANLIVAKAYLDQLSRSQALPAKQIASLQKAIRSAESSHMNKNKVAKLQNMAPSLEQTAATAKTPSDAARLRALAEILKHPSA
ncbi:MAG TPA: hypothetical protein VNU20_02370 [Candidatus Sulfotelmatobacter sp.]|jgi:hypothetical protein|nr:hypothetical protein [Candidatus Sulfotelmatobacter sp.]